jgi:hypothetical protein
MRVVGLGLLCAAGGMVLVGASRASGTDTARSAVTRSIDPHAPGVPNR